MRSASMGLMLLLVAVLALSVSGIAEAASGQQAPRAETVRRQFDPRDLSGIWLQAGGGEALGRNVPPMTAAGTAKLRERIPTGTVPKPSLSNDPLYKCNPMGFPRLVLDGEPIEFIHTEGRLLQLFQWEGTLRELWTDGRQLPQRETLAKLGPAWYGHSVGVWEGETLVVTTVGLDDRAWIDDRPGHPYSSDARFEERYRRISPDAIEFQLTLYDPKFYTTPWVGDKKLFRRVPREDTTYFGWYGLYSGISEGICAPVNEVEGYNKTFRDPSSER